MVTRKCSSSALSMTVVEVTKLFTQVMSLYDPVEVQPEGRTVVFVYVFIMMIGW